MDDLKFTDILDHFLLFYDKASVENADPERRFELWHKYYGFAAVPPGKRGDSLAKEMLDFAWERYSLVYDKIKYFEADTVKMKELLVQVKQSLQYSEPIHLTIVFFVGTFETDPFTIQNKDQTFSLYFPIESEWSDYRLTEELTRVVHCSKSGLAPSKTRTLGQLVFQEGLGLHTCQKVITEGSHTRAELLWSKEKCRQEPNRIMINLLPHLRRTDYEALYSFTKGTGASGYEKEANYTGWIVVKHLLEHGNTLGDLAAIPKNEVDIFLEESIFSLLNHAYLIQPQE